MDDAEARQAADAFLLRVVQNLRQLEAQGRVDLSRPADGETWV